MSALSILDDAGRFKDWRVLVTGATGFLGRHLVRALLQRCERVVSLARDHDCDRDHDPLVGQVLVRGDLSSVEALERVLAEYEVNVVFHLAAQTQVSTATADPTGTLEANVRGTWNMLEACRRQGVRRTIIASSDKSYGNGPVPYSENQALEPHGVYATSKAAADMVAQSYAREYGLPLNIVRCGNLYGPGHLNWSTLIPGTIRSVMWNERPVIRSDGQARRDYLHVEDAVEGYLALAGSLFLGAFNFGTGTPTRAIDVVQTILRLMGSSLEPDVRRTSMGEIHDQWVDVGKAKAHLGWEPRFGIEEGLKATIPWYVVRMAGRVERE